MTTQEITYVNNRFEIETTTIEGGGGSSKVERVVITQTTDLEDTHLDKTLQFDNASTNFDYNILNDILVSSPTGSTIVLTKTGDGEVTVKPGTDVVFYGAFGDQGFRLDGTYGSSAYLEKLPDDNSWEYSGVIKDLP